jgi:hypothetical protein
VKDEKKGIALLEEAAEAGHAGALNNLASLYEHGVVVPQDLAQAHQYYLAGAARGSPYAMQNLATMFLTGSGVPIDLAKAEHWASRAVGAGNADYEPTLQLIRAKIASSELELEQAGVCAWEREQGLVVEPGSNVRERLGRYMEYLADGKPGATEILDILARECAPKSSADDTLFLDRNELVRLAPTSPTAALYLRVQTVMDKAMSILRTLNVLPGGLACAHPGMMKHIVGQMSLVYQLSDLIPPLSPNDQKALVAATRLVLDADPNDEKACMVWPVINLFEDWVLAYLEKRTRQFPRNWFFPYLRGSLLGNVAEWQEGLNCFRAAQTIIKLVDPAGQDADLAHTKTELLYLQAAALRQLGGDKRMMRTTVASHLGFLKVAPPDHRKVPEGTPPLCLSRTWTRLWIWCGVRCACAVCE